MKHLLLLLLILVTLNAGSLQSATPVYEGFDYPPGPVAEQAGGSGWSGPWEGTEAGYVSGEGSDEFTALLADRMPATTGVLIKDQSAGGFPKLMRSIDPSVLPSALTADGGIGSGSGEIWVSLAGQISGDTPEVELHFALAKGGSPVLTIGKPKGIGVSVEWR